MSEFIGTIKNNPKPGKDITNCCYIILSVMYNTISDRAKGFNLKRIYGRAIEKIGETFGNMDKKIEPKHNKTKFQLMS